MRPFRFFPSPGGAQSSDLEPTGWDGQVFQLREWRNSQIFWEPRTRGGGTVKLYGAGGHRKSLGAQGASFLRDQLGEKRGQTAMEGQLPKGGMKIHFAYTLLLCTFPN